jgi:small subunit ribosomal protein S6
MSPKEVIRINPYEIMLMIEPEVAEERHGEIIDRINQTVTKAKGTWGQVEPWGKRRMAYEIKHQGEAWYYVITFESTAETLQEPSVASPAARLPDPTSSRLQRPRRPPRSPSAHPRILIRTHVRSRMAEEEPWQTSIASSSPAT